jgi:hypothetical protein
MVRFTNATQVAVTVPVASTSGFGAGWWSLLQNVSGAAVTFTPTTSTLFVNGTSAQTSYTMLEGESATISTDGTNYYIQSGWNPQFNVLNFGATAAGIGTNDQGAFQAAVNAAAAANLYGGLGGASVYIPCGEYGLASHISLPRNQNASYLFGIVPLLGEDKSCVELRGMSTFATTTATISSASESGSTITYTASANLNAAFINGTAVAISGVTPRGYNMLCHAIAGVSSPGAQTTFTCTSNLTGLGAGTGGTATLVDGLITWAQTANTRTKGQVIQNMTIGPPAVAGVVSIFYPYSSSNIPVTSSNDTNERLDRLQLSNIEFLGSNQYNPADIYFQGDCFDCIFTNLTDNSSRAAGGVASNNFETSLIVTDTCVVSGVLPDEGCGVNYSTMNNLQGGATRGGFSPAFQGRINQSSFNTANCNGMLGGFTNSQCYAFYNSWGSTITNLSNEGLGDQPQILVNGSQGLDFDVYGTGTPGNQGYGIGDGLDLVNSSRNTFRHIAGPNLAADAWNVQQIVTSVTVGGAGGSGYTGTPTVTVSGPVCPVTPTFTINLTGGVISSVTVLNGGNCNGTPTLTIANAGGGSGATLTAVMSSAGAYFQVKMDSNSHTNRFLDTGLASATDFSISDTATNYFQYCVNVSTGCTSGPYTVLGAAQPANTGVPVFQGPINSGGYTLNTFSPTSANAIRLSYPINFVAPVIFSSITLSVGTAAVATATDVGVYQYSGSGTTWNLICSWGGITAVSTGIVSNNCTQGANQSITNPAQTIMATCSNTTTPAFYNYSGTVFNNAYTTSTTCTTGVLPATMTLTVGTLTGSSNVGFYGSLNR